MNWQKLHKSIQGFKGWRASAFILALAERGLPNAQLYMSSLDDENLPDAESLDEVMDAAWQQLIVRPSEEGIVELLDCVATWIPERGEDVPYGVFPTADCLELLEQALLSGVNQESPRCVPASQQSMATITHFIEFSEGDGLDEDQLIKLFDRHALMEREFSFQEELRDLLRTATSPSDKTLRQVRMLAQDEGISNIGISLAEE